MRKMVTLLSILIISFLSPVVLAANSSIEGTVKDSKTGEPLFGANVILVGTSMGGATDMDGKYSIPSVAPGTYTIRVSYIGYKEQKSEIKISAGAHVKKDFKLEAVGIEGQTVVVTAQASGQKAAINQQLTSDQIVNVVSAAKIQELPDANAAESVGRLPGISVLRDGGEGNKVVIRGLAPKYNKIMVDGVQLSSSDPDDRSTDLSMVSSNMLEGIQVSKSVTADMDADVLGGTVNFELREARVKQPGVPEFSLMVQGGYNNLSNVYNKMNNYKYVISGENRFLDSKLGVFAQIDIERKNLSSNEMGATYTHANESFVNYWTTDLTLSDIYRDRQRYNAALVVDYQLPEGKIKFDNFLSSGSTQVINRQETYNVDDNAHDFALSSSTSKLNILTNSINLQHKLFMFDADLKLSHTYSETKDPNDWSIDFMQSSAGINDFYHVASVDPQDIPKKAKNNFATAYSQNISNSNSFSRERAITASLDLKTDLNISDLVTAQIKFGGKYRYQNRSYVYEVYNGQSANGGSALFVDSLIESHFNIPISKSTGVPMSYFVDKNFDYGEFMNGDYKMVGPLNYAMLSDVMNLLNRNLQTIAANNGQVTYAKNNYLSTIYNYNGHEHTSALYLMSILNIGPDITIIPGVRYQLLKTAYTSVHGLASAESFFNYNHYDTTAVKSHGYWLPDVSVKYKPFSWFDIRLSYTSTVSYPDFSSIIPRIDMSGNWIGFINSNLVPSRSKNYDLYLSFYENTIGLFTVGAFLKQIDDLIYPWTFYATGVNALPYLPTKLIKNYGTGTTYSISTYVNDSYKINDYGVELDWQTHFWYLPGPLSGLVFSTNYTHIFSKAEYPYTYTKTTGRTTKYIDTSYTDRLLYQPDDIINLSLGFDYEGFSVRVSLLYQADIFTGPDFWTQLKSHTSAYRRWDLSAKQELPWFGVQVYGDINNINGANDISVIQGGGVPTSEQAYGLTADLGIRVKF